MEPLTPLAAFQGLVLALACAITIDARKEPTPWRYILFVLAASFALVGVFASWIGGQWPRTLGAMTALGADPTTWLVVLVALYFILRQKWKRPNITAEEYDNRMVRTEFDALRARIETAETDLSTLTNVENFAPHPDSWEAQAPEVFPRCPAEQFIALQGRIRQAEKAMELIDELAGIKAPEADYNNHDISWIGMQTQQHLNKILPLQDRIRSIIQTFRLIPDDQISRDDWDVNKERLQVFLRGSRQRLDKLMEQMVEGTADE